MKHLSGKQCVGKLSENSSYRGLQLSCVKRAAYGGSQPRKASGSFKHNKHCFLCMYETIYFISYITGPILWEIVSCSCKLMMCKTQQLLRRDHKMIMSGRDAFQFYDTRPDNNMVTTVPKQRDVWTQRPSAINHSPQIIFFLTGNKISDTNLFELDWSVTVTGQWNEHKHNWQHRSISLEINIGSNPWLSLAVVSVLSSVCFCELRNSIFSLRLSGQRWEKRRSCACKPHESGVSRWPSYWAITPNWIQSRLDVSSSLWL